MSKRARKAKKEDERRTKETEEANKLFLRDFYNKMEEQTIRPPQEAVDLINRRFWELI